MSEIDNDNRSDNDEQRRIARSRENNRKDIERRLAREPAKNFESKLTEKATREQELKQQSQARQKPGAERKKKSGEAGESLVEHFLGVAHENSAEEAKGRVNRLRGQGQHDDLEKHAKDEFGKDDVEFHEDKDTHTTAKTESGKTEVSGETHKRIEEQPKQGGGGGGTGQGSSQGQDSGGGQQGFGAGTGRDGSQNKQAVLTGKNPANKPGTVFAVKQTGTGTQGRFQQQAPAFTRKDLDDIVSSVELSVAAGGNDQLTVQLENTYYDGLKIQAERTDQGVILRFICPNTSVRSTFVKYRPQVYDHLKAKGVKVFRIDVV